MTYEEALRWLERKGGRITKDTWATGKFTCSAYLPGYVQTNASMDDADEDGRRRTIVMVIEDMKLAVEERERGG